MLENKVALITGGSRGIGRAIAERFARDGAIVGIVWSRNEAAARDTVERIVRDGGRAFALHTDLGTPGDAGHLWAAFDEAAGDLAPGGGLDILVHNAAKGSFTRLEGLAEDEFDRVFATSVKAPFFVTKLALPRLRDGGRIINISSIAATVASPELIAYAAAKGALDAFTHTLAQQLGPRRITVNAVSPGVTLTDNNAHLLTNEPAAAQATARVALGRLGEPEDIADIVAFLASDQGRWITGQVIDASGGTQL
ncbi:SDR family NAD(P)-dependent oxidoreductase [Cryptosporangium arvum]|uniref:SDR family NAD(P)-dependent oxidoreductase n=1 Tax=Cryptosporangium arvum TaxID=80871 RepID=UPI0004BB8B50|nr:SDR family oxidoreductase [Cryptosporangium arvum]